MCCQIYRGTSTQIWNETTTGKERKTAIGIAHPIFSVFNKLKDKLSLVSDILNVKNSTNTFFIIFVPAYQYV